MKKQLQPGQTVVDFVLQHTGSTDPVAVWAVVSANPDIFGGDSVSAVKWGTWLEIPDGVSGYDERLVTYYSDGAIVPNTNNRAAELGDFNDDFSDDFL